MWSRLPVNRISHLVPNKNSGHMTHFIFCSPVFSSSPTAVVPWVRDGCFLQQPQQEHQALPGSGRAFSQSLHWLLRHSWRKQHQPSSLGTLGSREAQSNTAHGTPLQEMDIILCCKCTKETAWTLNSDLVGLHLCFIAMLFSSYKHKEQVSICYCSVWKAFGFILVTIQILYKTFFLINQENHPNK